VEPLLGLADQLSLGGYAVGVTGTSPTLTVQVEQSFDNVRWMNRNLNPEVLAVALSTAAETNFSGCDGNPAERPASGFARLRINLGGANAKAQVRIWATGRDPEGDTTPVSILGQQSVLQWCRADLGVTILGTQGGFPAVFRWKDMTGAGNDYTQATLATRPVLGGGPNGTKAIYFDGSNDELIATGPNLPAPGTTPTYVWLVLEQSAWMGNDGIFGANLPVDANNYIAMHQNPTSPNLRQTCGVTPQDNGGLPVPTTWGRVELAYTNSTADFIKCRSTTVTGTNVGNNGGSTGRRLGKTNNSSVTFGNFGLAEIVYAKRIPTAEERAALDAYCTERYGPGLV